MYENEAVRGTKEKLLEKKEGEENACSDRKYEVSTDSSTTTLEAVAAARLSLRTLCVSVIRHNARWALGFLAKRL